MFTMDRFDFRCGYELGLQGESLPPEDSSEMFWNGFSWANLETMGIFKATKWQARRKRVRDFLFHLRLRLGLQKGRLSREWSLWEEFKRII